MKIQYVSYGKINLTSKHHITNSTLQEPQSLDMFDINIFSLQNSNLWKSKGVDQKIIDCLKDFNSIRQMISTSQKSINVVALPQNYEHSWSYYSGQYNQRCLLKDEISILQNNLLYAIIPQKYSKLFSLIYENSVTKINDSSFQSAFCFMNLSDVLTKSYGSGKPTTIRFGNLILTTLKLDSADSCFDDFIKGIGLDSEKADYPKWLFEHVCFDDEQQKALIDESNKEICALNKRIEDSRAKLEENLKYKSILSTNGDVLVSVVLEMLGKLLSYDFSEFIDEKREDFLCKLTDITFVGEIKGVTSNVKYEHVTQVEVHRSKYLDRLKEENRVEKTKTLLIINPMRNKPLSEREPINDEQIGLAEKFGSLIITTEVFLKIFEKYLNGEISNERIISVFKNRIGLLPIEAFYKSKEKVDNSAYKM